MTHKAKKIETGEYLYRTIRICRNSGVSPGYYGAWRTDTVYFDGHHIRLSGGSLKECKDNIDYHWDTRIPRCKEREKMEAEAKAPEDRLKNYAWIFDEGAKAAQDNAFVYIATPAGGWTEENISLYRQGFALRGYSFGVNRKGAGVVFDKNFG